MLEVDRLTTGYGRIEVLHDVSLTARRGEIVTIVGANGAGKTTLLMPLFGRPRPRRGKVRLEDVDITDLKPGLLPRRGVAIAPEGRRVFPKMSVRENLLLGALDLDADRVRAGLRSSFDLFPELFTRMNQRAGTMSGGEQQMLAIARALMSDPRFLLLDEPSLGLAPLVMRRIFEAVRRINLEKGVTVLLVEQNAHAALALADTAYVLQNGSVRKSGPAASLLEDPEIKALYLAA